MGDAGSTTIGLLLATIGIYYQQTHLLQLASGFVPVFLILLLPLTDTTFVFCTRLLRGQHFYFGGKDHLSHRIMNAGFRPRTAVLLQYLFSLTSGAIAVWVIDAEIVIQLLAVQVLLYAVAEGSRKLYRIGL